MIMTSRDPPGATLPGIDHKQPAAKPSEINRSGQASRPGADDHAVEEILHAAANGSLQQVSRPDQDLSGTSSV
jgi:hypothetical protein